MSHPHDADNYIWPTCTCCGRDLRDDELGRVACRPCQHRADLNLAALAGRPAFDDDGKSTAGLYALLSYTLERGASPNSGRVTGSHEAPLPLRLAPLSLCAEGGVVSTLQLWAEDWHDHMRRTPPTWRGSLQQRVDTAAQTLRFNLDWAAREHPAFHVFADEISKLAASCRAAISPVTGERSTRVPIGYCPTIRQDTGAVCGQQLKTSPWALTIRCAGCGTQWGRDEWLRLGATMRGLSGSRLAA